MEIRVPTKWLLWVVIVALGCGFTAPNTRAGDCAKAFVDALKANLAKTGDSNPFFSASTDGLSHEDLWVLALDALVDDPGLPDGLRGEAATKAYWWPHPAGNEKWNAVWSALSPAKKAQAAAEFSLTAFNHAQDGKFRSLILQQLGISPNSDEHTIEQLLPIAAGARFVNDSELRQAADAIQSIADRTGSYPIRFEAAVARTDTRDILEHEPIESVQKLGGGMNQTLLVKFKNGKKGIFKPRSGEVEFSTNNRHYVAFSREATFSELVDEFLGNGAAIESGKSSVEAAKAVPVVIVHQGKNYGVGSIQIFADGYFDIEKISKDPRYSNVWQQMISQPQWKSIENRIRTIDNIAGNYDRLPLSINNRTNPKNFMIKLDNIDFTDPARAEKQLQQANWDHLRAMLIDNGLGRNIADIYKFSIKGNNHFPRREDVPPDLREAILHFDNDKFKQSMKDRLSPEGIYDVLLRVSNAKKRFLWGGP